MATKTRLRRPSKAMTLAVNAAIDRKDTEVARLIKDHDLDTAELEQRLVLRDGRQYELNGHRRRVVKEPTVRAERGTRERSPGVLDVNIAIDGRTSIAKLYRIMTEAERLKVQAQQELKRRPPEQIEPVKKALAEIELLRRKREKLEEQIRAAESVLDAPG